jgi:hypothetical protein
VADAAETTHAAEVAEAAAAEPEGGQTEGPSDAEGDEAAATSGDLLPGGPDPGGDQSDLA